MKKIQDQHAFSRRAFLRGATGASLAIPFLPSLARAQTTSPKRVVFVVSRNGTWRSHWRLPQGFETNAVSGQGTHYRELSELSGTISNTLENPGWNSLIPKMNILRGLDGMAHYAHNRTVALTGGRQEGDYINTMAEFCYSVDSVMAESSQVYQSAPQLSALHLSPSVNDSGNLYHRSWSWNTVAGEKVRIRYEHDVAAAFSQVFGNGIPEPTGGESQAQRRARVLDRVRSGYQRLLTHPRLSGSDRQRLEAYFERINALEASILANQNRVCEAPNLSPLSDLETAYDQNFDVLTNALACDLTRVAVVDIYALPEHLETTGDWHYWSHLRDDNWPYEISRQIQKWIGDQVLSLAQKLEATDDGEGKTLLDNTLFVWTNELGFGNGHQLADIPVLTLGSCGGSVQTGRYLDYRQRPFVDLRTSNLDTTQMGIPYNNFLVSTMQAMGLTPADYQRGGVTGFGEYIVPANAGDGYDRYISGANRNQPLPDFLTS